MHTGAQLQDLSFKCPSAALFFHHSPNKLIVACQDDILIVEVTTKFTQSFESTPQRAYFLPHALALSADDSILVAGCNFTNNVTGYDVASLKRLWIHETASHVGAVCMLGAHVLATVRCNPTLVLDFKTGTQIAKLQKADGWILGMDVIEGLCFILS